jgi:Zn-dependent protease with chaperone function
LKAIALLEQAVGRNRGTRFVSLLENRWWIVVGCLLILSAWVWVFISFGIPFFAEKVAYKVPIEISEKVSLEALKFLDSRILTRSNLDNEKVIELNNVCQGLRGEFGSNFDYRLEFRKGPNIGPNAFALPSGLIILTDELIALVQSEKELVAVLVHEMTHVEKRHGLRSLFQDAGVFLLISALVGDVASITSAASMLPQFWWNPDTQGNSNEKQIEKRDYT